MGTAAPVTACQVSAQQPATGLSRDRVWSVLTQGEALPAFARHLIAVVPLPDNLQEWSAYLNGSAVGWTQRYLPTSSHELRFEQVTGDFAELRGRWTLAEDFLRLRVEFDLGIDGLAPLLNPIWTQAVGVHCTELVRAVASAARSGVSGNDEGSGRP